MTIIDRFLPRQPPSEPVRGRISNPRPVIGPEAAMKASAEASEAARRANEYAKALATLTSGKATRAERLERHRGVPDFKALWPLQVPPQPPQPTRGSAIWAPTPAPAQPASSVARPASPVGGQAPHGLWSRFSD